jgi:hypothetical protein
LQNEDKEGPSQKLGIVAPNMEKSIERRSTGEYGLRADISPRGREIRSARHIAATVSSRVAGYLSRIVVRTGFL